MNELLRKLRLEAGLTQEDLAGKIGLTRSAYTMIENGDRTPSLRTAKALADTLGVTVDQLIADSEETGAAAINAEGQEEDDGNSQTPEREEG